MRGALGLAVLGVPGAQGGGPSPVYVTGPVSLTPTIGEEQLLNGDFSTWTADNPASWSVTGEDGSDPMVTQVAADGSAGTGAARFYSTTVNQPRISQNRVTAGVWYRVEANISTWTSGGLRAQFSNSTQVPWGYEASGAGVHSGVARAPFSFGPQLMAAGTGLMDFVLDSVSAKPLTLSTMYSILSDAFVPSVIQAKITKSATYPAGIIHWADANNFVILHIDSRSQLVLEKCVGGTYTAVGSTAVTYFAGAMMELHYDAANKTYAAYYNDSETPKIAATSINDEVFTTALGAGVFGTDETATFEDFAALP